MAWLVLSLAGLLEIVLALGLKFTDGFTRPLPSVVTGVALVGSTLLLAHASRTLPIGTAYAVWVGIGVIGAALGGIVLFDEPITPLRSTFLILLTLSIVGLKWSSAEPDSFPPEEAPKSGVR